MGSTTRRSRGRIDACELTRVCSSKPFARDAHVTHVGGLYCSTPVFTFACVPRTTDIGNAHYEFSDCCLTFYAFRALIWSTLWLLSLWSPSLHSCSWAGLEDALATRDSILGGWSSRTSTFGGEGLRLTVRFYGAMAFVPSTTSTSPQSSWSARGTCPSILTLDFFTKTPITARQAQA